MLELARGLGPFGFRPLKGYHRSLVLTLELRLADDCDSPSVQQALAATTDVPTARFAALSWTRRVGMR